MSVSRCEGCGEYTVLLPLHGGKGGPLRCPLCVGKWNAEHGRRRRTGRIVIRAIKAFYDAGGTLKDLNKLKHSAAMMGLGGLLGLGFDVDSFSDPLGYMDGIARMDGADVDLTSELLKDVLQLTHPDHHPTERKEMAHRVTQALLALQPFVFPAPKPKPPPAPTSEPPSTRSRTKGRDPASPQRYPCPDCADTTPYFYCDVCKAQYNKRQQEEDERRRAKQRKWYARRKLLKTPSKPAPRDKDKPRNSRQSTVAVNQTTWGNLTNHSLSGLQAGILVAALTKRADGGRGCDISQAELLVEIWGWKITRKLRWTTEDAARNKNYRAGDTLPSCDIHGAFNHIPRREYRAARASLSRAITRLEQRMLISFVSGTWGTYSGGFVLTPHGERIARQLLAERESI